MIMRNKSFVSKNELLTLLLDEKNKIPNKEGNTPLTLKALEISKLSDFSREKKHYEKLVSDLVDFFETFNQTHFSELDSFITISKMYVPDILSSFSTFVKKVEKPEDLSLKACVARFIIDNNTSFFQLDYIKDRFASLRDADPWLYAELIIMYNWNEGVSLISEILKKNNDSSYLFVLITNWMTQKDKEEQLTVAFQEWAKYFTTEDKNILKLFCEQYGFNNTHIISPTPHYNEASVQIIQSPALLNFKKANTPLQFESIKS